MLDIDVDVNVDIDIRSGRRHGHSVTHRQKR